MDQPEQYEDGFDVKTIIGAIFIGFVMMPGAIYLGLVAGRNLGPAAEWTTIILFTEVARRSFITLKRQEVYILFYIAAALASTSGGLQLAGGIFAGKIWDQYFVRSPAARGLGIAYQIPSWVVPSPDSEALLKRTFFHPDWYYPMAIMMLGVVLSRLNWFGLGYTLFRITSDYERLPFPYAAITAQGSTALAETTTKTETWRWRVFAIGAMVGLVFVVAMFSFDVRTALLLSLRLGNILAVSVILFRLVTPAEMGVALHRLGVPHVGTFILTTAMRYVPLMAQKMRNITDAQRSRGIDLRVRWRNLRNFTALLMPLLAQAFLLSEELAIAMESRGFFSKVRTNRRQLRFALRDYTLTAASFLLLALFLWWERTRLP